jgi:hypothetical protein
MKRGHHLQTPNAKALLKIVSWRQFSVFGLCHGSPGWADFPVLLVNLLFPVRLGDRRSTGIVEINFW